MKNILFILSFFFLLVNTTYSADFLLTGSTIQSSGGKLALPDSTSGVHINNDAFLSNSLANMDISGNFWLSDTSSTVDETLGWATFDIGNVLGAPKVVLKNNGLNGSSERIFTFSGFAWSHAAGWIYFSPILLKDGLGVDISNSKLDFNMHSGVVSGCAWSQNLGWICLETSLVMDITPPDLSGILKPVAANYHNVSFTLDEMATVTISNRNNVATYTTYPNVTTFTHDMRKANILDYHIIATDLFGNTSSGYIKVVANQPSATLGANDIGGGSNIVPLLNGGTLGTTKISDGIDKHIINIKLRDAYGNPVIPVAGVKDVEVTLGLNNNLDKDQIDDTSSNLGDAVTFGNNDFVGLLYGAGYTEGTSFGTSDGDYELEIKSYAPSSSGYIYTTPNNNIGVSKYIVKVTNLGTYIGVGEYNQNLALTYYRDNFKFEPSLRIVSVTNSDNGNILRDYETTFTGEIEGQGSSSFSDIKVTHILDIMTGTININNKVNYQNFSTGANYFCQGFYTGSYYSSDTECIKGITKSSNIKKIYIGNHLSNVIISDGFKVTPRLLASGYTRFNTKYSSELSYKIDGKEVKHPSYSIIYNSDILNNEVKISGLVNKNNNNFSVIEDSSIVSIGKVSKLDVYTMVHKNAFEYARNGTGTYETKYIKGDYSLPSTWPAGIETIIVDGGDITIGTGITKIPSRVKVLIALKDKNGNGGNIYIKKNVQKIYATLISDKSIISGDGVEYYTDNLSARDQLYIKGSVLSYNTIGGSSSNPLICPYYLKTICDFKNSKRYDFNHFRSYIKGVSGNNSVPGLTIFPGYDTAPMIIEYDSDIQLNIPKILKSK